MGPAMDKTDADGRTGAQRARRGRDRGAAAAVRIGIGKRARVEWRSRVECGEVSSLKEKFKFLLGKNEGGRRKKGRKGTAGEVLLLGGLRVLHVYAPDPLLAGSWRNQFPWRWAEPWLLLPRHPWNEICFPSDISGNTFSYLEV